MRNQQDIGDILPLRRRFESNISIDRFSEKSFHGLYFDDRSCSKFFNINLYITIKIKTVGNSLHYKLILEYLFTYIKSLINFFYYL